MVKIITQNNCLNITLHEEILSSVLDPTDGTWGAVQPIETPSVVKDSKEDKSIQCSSFSPNGKYFAVCYNKVLIIYNVPSWTILCQGTTDRKAVSVQFFPKSNVILVADKSGSVIFYSYSDGCLNKEDLVLGHNSMLTGALVTDDECYVITCDRDEKIRVSKYPNVYNIESYCLGHEQFVSCIHFLQSDKRVLISASGDGSVKFWDFEKGKELMNYRKSFDESERIPIVKIECYEENKICLVAALEYKSKIVTVLKVQGNLDEGLKNEVYKQIDLTVSPWDITFWNGNLISFLPDKTSPITIHAIGEKNNANSFKNLSNYLISNWDSVLDICNKIEDIIPVLYKREIDNVQEYQERKKARLSKNNKSNELVS